MDARNHALHSRDWKGVQRNFYAMPFGERYIWGVTAGILRNLYERIYRSSGADHACGFAHSPRACESAYDAAMIRPVLTEFALFLAPFAVYASVCGRRARACSIGVIGRSRASPGC